MKKMIVSLLVCYSFNHKLESMEQAKNLVKKVSSSSLLQDYAFYNDCLEDNLDRLSYDDLKEKIDVQVSKSYRELFQEDSSQWVMRQQIQNGLIAVTKRDAQSENYATRLQDALCILIYLENKSLKIDNLFEKPLMHACQLADLAMVKLILKTQESGCLKTNNMPFYCSLALDIVKKQIETKQHLENSLAIKKLLKNAMKL